MKAKLAFLILCAAVLGMSSAVAKADTIVTVEMTFDSTINWGDNNYFSGVVNIGTDLNGFTLGGTVLFPPTPCAGGISSACEPPDPCLGAAACTRSNAVILPSSGVPKWELNGVMFNSAAGPAVASYSVGLGMNGTMLGMGPFDLYFATGMSDPGIPVYDVYYYDASTYVGTLEVFATTTPLPAALPLFATGLGALGLLGWRSKRKNTAALAAA
jgi:hypothetical protein